MLTQIMRVTEGTNYVYDAVRSLDLLQEDAKICITIYSLWLYSISIYSIDIIVLHCPPFPKLIIMYEYV